jgi:hypothetical protein
MTKLFFEKDGYLRRFYILLKEKEKLFFPVINHKP